MQLVPSWQQKRLQCGVWQVTVWGIPFALQSGSLQFERFGNLATQLARAFTCALETESTTLKRERCSWEKQMYLVARCAEPPVWKSAYDGKRNTKQKQKQAIVQHMVQHDQHTQRTQQLIVQRQRKLAYSCTNKQQHPGARALAPEHILAFWAFALGRHGHARRSHAHEKHTKPTPISQVGPAAYSIYYPTSDFVFFQQFVPGSGCVGNRRPAALSAPSLFGKINGLQLVPGTVTTEMLPPQLNSST